MYREETLTLLHMLETEIIDVVVIRIRVVRFVVVVGLRESLIIG